MVVAGIQVQDTDILELARLVHETGFDETAETLIVALESERSLVGLTIPDREAILSSLIDPPDGLCELQAILLTELMQRLNSGQPI